MATAREIEAWRRRLARRTTAEDLAVECIGAVIAFTDSETEDQVVGTLTSVRAYQGIGLFGPVVRVDVTVCTDCVGRVGLRCEESDPYTLSPVDKVTLLRNEDGVAEAIAAAVAS